MEKKATVQESFGSMGDMEEIDESMLNVCEEFVCRLYNGKKIKLVNDLCFDMFLTKYKTTHEQHLNEVKKIDASSLPPCQCVLKEKILWEVINISKSTNSTYTKAIRMEP